MKLFLYVSENDRIIHLIKKTNKYELVCNNKKTINKNRIAKRIEQVYIIAPEPNNKIRCINCEKKVRSLMTEMINAGVEVDLLELES